jgi:uncharacterized protein
LLREKLSTLAKTRLKFGHYREYGLLCSSRHYPIPCPMNFSIQTFIYSVALLIASLGFMQGAESKPPAEKSLLWEISGPGLAQPSYLYGTMHLACPRDLMLSPGLSKSFSKTQQLYLEIDVDDPALSMQMLQHLPMKNGGNLKTLLNPKDYAKADQFFQQNLKLPLDRVSQIKPLFLAGMIYPAFLGCQPSSWEKTLAGMAASRKMNILGLETVQEQITALDGISQKEQASGLMRVVNDPFAARREVNNLTAVYKAQDIAKLYQVFQNSPDMTPQYAAIVLDNRNQRWIPRILKAAKAKPTFFGVGAAHLGGNQGVISLLRKAGYTVKPVPAQTGN